MNLRETHNILQLIHTGTLVDILEEYERLNLLELRTSINETEQRLAARARVQQFGLCAPKDVFQLFSEIFGFVEWRKKITDTENSWKADACKLCAIAIKRGTIQPCKLFCIDPLRALCSALQPAFTLTVQKTLWESDSCSFVISKQSKFIY